MLRQKKGQTTVEFTLVVILFLSILMTIVDFGLMFFVNQTIQNAVREGARYAVTGRSEAGLDVRASMEARIREQSMGFYDKNAHQPNAIVIETLPDLSTIQTNTLFTGTPTASTGGSLVPISVTYTYSWPLLTPFLQPFFTNQQYTFTVKTYVLNEPY
jgi:Flp pilus assembly protein TadG